ncbi:ribosomal RNA-processing protein 7 homolog A [Culicoides brevitarsis]|uniref:ribosomal RNA-processing protein 7 homolog A n=1 Tax=Culicoides brevitarsis TaxID=469753 RepID=UPI00307B4A7D
MQIPSKSSEEDNTSAPTTGLLKWIEDYKNKIRPEEELQAEVDEYLKEFDAKAETGDNQADDDEWTVVGKNGKQAGFKQKESVVSKLEAKLLKDREKLMPTFYANQAREYKKQHLIKLKKKFAEDKSKIEHIKKHRRFKPF